MNVGTARRILFALCLPLAGIAANAQSAPTTVHSLPKPVAVSPKVITNYGKLPLSFEPNVGQTSKQVQWLARGSQYTLFLAGHDAVLELNKITSAKRGKAEQPKISSSALRMNLLGTAAPERASGEETLPGKVNYFTGKDPSKWQRDVPTYGKVRMPGVYPGIDLAYYGHQGRLEYDFVVAPGANASAIQLRFDGAKAKIVANGDLVLPLAGADPVRFGKPVVYQMKNGVRQPVDGSFMIAKNQQVSFRVGAYDKSRELIIDPTLIFAGTLGTGNGQTVAEGMAVDAAGEIFLTGVTQDLTFPTTSGALQMTCPAMSPPSAANGITRCGTNDGTLTSGFVTKISADGTSLVYSTYLHGVSGGESGKSVAVDAAGDAYVLGATTSNDFPVTADAINNFCLPAYAMNGCCTITTTVYSTCDGYFAGGGTEWVVGGPSLFISKLNPSGSALLYSTFFGGTDAIYPVGLALDSSNNIYFSGYDQNARPASNIYPNSNAIQYPVTASGYQQVGVGMQAATLSELSADGHTLLYSTFLGTLATNSFFAYTNPLAMALGPNGMAYVGGYTLASGYPTTPGSVRPACVENATTPANCEAYTGFVSAIDTTQSGAASLAYSTFIGGTEVPGANSVQTEVNALAADNSNNLYVAGYTSTIDYPTTAGAYQPTCGHANAANQCSQAFVSKINPPGSAYVWSTYYGGTSSNPPSTSASGVTVDAAGRVYLYGLSSGGGDVPQVNPVQPWYGNDEIFIATLSADAKQLLFGTYFGNPQTVVANASQPIANNGIGLDAAGNIYFAGYTNAGVNWASSTPDTYATPITGGSDLTFFGKISPVLALNTTTLTITPSTTTTGQIVTFTATVAGTTLITPAPTGTVTLTNGNTAPPTVLGTITLDNGTGTFTTSSLPAGTYSVTASYSGDSTYDVSASSAMPLTITTPSLVLVPNVVGLTQSAATTSITGAGLVVGTVSTASSSTVPSGSVISEAPLAGTSVAVGSSVNLVVSSGPAMVAVPNVVGLTQAAATTSITGAGLVVGTVTTASSSTVPSGSVISESPLAGTSVAVGSSVNLVVSTGSAPVAVPNVVGLTQSAATTSITTAGLVVGTITTASSSTVPSGSVISEAPLAGTSVAVGSSVNLVVSTGPAHVLVPNVVGLTQSAATTSITGAGLVVGTVTTASSSTVPSGSVISEAPLAGTSVAVGSSVNLVVSSGPAMVAVPNVVGLTQAAATTSITGAGLVVGTVTTASSSTVPSGSVISESPLAGTSVAVGSSVNLVVSMGSAHTGNFTITADPPAETVKRGVLGGFILQLKSVNGFNGNVTLSCSGGPAGSECADLPQTVKVNGTAYAVSGILFPKNATHGTYTITFTGVSGTLTNTATAKFTVE